MSHRFSRFLAIFMLVASTGAMLMTSFDAEARRMGGGKSFGRQSSNITQQRQAITPPAARTAPSAAAAAPTAAAGAAGATARSGMSKWLGPMAGIAAGLGIAALLSHLGLSGAFLEMMSSLILIGLVVFAVIFLVRKLRDSAAGGAMRKQTAGGPSPARPPQAPESSPNMWRQSGQAASTAARPAAVEPVPAAPVDEKWFIPADFDTPTFLANAKSQFIAIQALWDSGDVEKLREYLTDDLVSEIKPQMLERNDTTHTEVVLLNAELLGIEKVSEGHLASVRYSGMLREAKNTEAFRFEEVWNLYKAADAGWLLAGIQQIPVDLEA